MNIRDIIILVILAGGAMYVWHCEGVKEKHAVFVGQVELLGKEAEAAAKKREKDDKDSKEKADAKHKRDTDSLHATIKRLRDEASTSGGSVSANPAGSRCPENQVCFDKAEYQRTDGGFVKGARGLADEGSEIAVGMETAQKWAIGTLK